MSKDNGKTAIIEQPAGVYSPQQAAELARRQIQRYQDNPNASLVTGIDGFDELLQPLRSNICIIHGITDHGKSTLTDIITENNLPDPDSREIIVKVLLEDTIEEQTNRNASANTSPFLSVHQITSGKMNDEEMQNFERSLLKLSERPIWLIGNSQEDHKRQTLTTVPMLLEAINWIEDTQDVKIKLIVADYFQKFAKHQSRYARTNRDIYMEQVDMLDSIAQGFGCPLLLLSQSNRTPDEQKRVPQKSDLQETSRLEQAARTVIVVYRPHLHHNKGTFWEYAGQSILIEDDKYVLLGIQKQKYKEANVYRLFKTNEQRQMKRVDLRNALV